MKHLSEEKFRRLKNTDTLVIYGCGASINQITPAQWRRLKRFDSVGFNWFFKAGINTTYYIVYEQGRSAKYGGDETERHLIRGLNKIKTNYILHSAYARRISNKLNGAGRIFHCRKFGPKHFGRNIFKTLSHGKSTLFTALHLGIGMGYKRFIFAGVDLYDTRYFWLPDGKPRPIMAARGINPLDRHKTSGPVIRAAGVLKNKFGIKMEVVNHKSLLNGVAKPWGKR